MSVPARALPFLALMAIGAIWGATQPLAKIAVSTGHKPLGLMVWQAGIGALLLGGVTLLRGRRVPVTAAALRLYLVIALIGSVLPGITSYSAAVHLPSGVLSILLSSVPMWAFPIALLHECGLFVSTPSYHKHSNYLISNSEIFGLNSLDHTLAALVARYHRRAFPKPSHTTYAQLDRDSRVMLTQMAAILRIAIALAQSRTQRIRSVECVIEKGRLIIIASGRKGDLSMEQLELRQNSTLFEEVFGMSVLLRESRD